MEAGRPVELAFSPKVVPLNAITNPVKTAEEALPAGADVAPGTCLGKVACAANGTAGRLGGGWTIHSGSALNSSVRYLGEEVVAGKGGFKVKEVKTGNQSPLTPTRICGHAEIS